MPTHIQSIDVGFGDCDPGGIVYYPNFFRWFDASTHAMFAAVGESFEKSRREHGWTVWPLVDAGATFHVPARPNERIEIHSTIVKWTRATFRIEHRALRDATLLAEGWEIRCIGAPHPDDPRRLRAVPIPDALRRLLPESAPPCDRPRAGAGRAQTRRAPENRGRQ